MSHASKSDRFPLLAAGILGLTGIALGAMAAHALKATLAERGMTVAWETGARYHILHAVALLGVAAWTRNAPTAAGANLAHWTTRLWCVGIVLFSGSLYWLALGGPRWLGPVTPFGGLALMIGWLLLIVAAIKGRE